MPVVRAHVLVGLLYESVEPRLSCVVQEQHCLGVQGQSVPGVVVVARRRGSMAIVGSSEKSLLVMFILIGLTLHREAAPNTLEDRQEAAPGLLASHHLDSLQEEEGSGTPTHHPSQNTDTKLTKHGHHREPMIGDVSVDGLEEQPFLTFTTRPDYKIHTYTSRKSSITYNTKRPTRTFDPQQSVIFPTTKNHRSSHSLKPPTGAPTSQIPLLENTIQLAERRVRDPTQLPVVWLTTEELPATSGDEVPTAPSTSVEIIEDSPTSTTPAADAEITLTEDATDSSMLNGTTDSYLYDNILGVKRQAGRNRANFTSKASSAATYNVNPSARLRYYRMGPLDSFPHRRALRYNNHQRPRANTAKVPLKTLHIGGLFELTDTAGTTSGQSELAAARLAVSHINRKRVVPGYKLQLVQNDTKVRYVLIILGLIKM